MPPRTPSPSAEMRSYRNSFSLHSLSTPQHDPYSERQNLFKWDDSLPGHAEEEPAFVTYDSPPASTPGTRMADAIANTMRRFQQVPNTADHSIHNQHVDEDDDVPMLTPGRRPMAVPQEQAMPPARRLPRMGTSSRQRSPASNPVTRSRTLTPDRATRVLRQERRAMTSATIPTSTPAITPMPVEAQVAETGRLRPSIPRRDKKRPLGDITAAVIAATVRDWARAENVPPIEVARNLARSGPEERLRPFDPTRENTFQHRAGLAPGPDPRTQVMRRSTRSMPLPRSPLHTNPAAAQTEIEPITDENTPPIQDAWLMPGVMRTQEPRIRRPHPLSNSFTATLDEGSDEDVATDLAPPPASDETTTLMPQFSSLMDTPHPMPVAATTAKTTTAKMQPVNPSDVNTPTATARPSTSESREITALPDKIMIIVPPPPPNCNSIIAVFTTEEFDIPEVPASGPPATPRRRPLRRNTQVAIAIPLTVTLRSKTKITSEGRYDLRQRVGTKQK